MGSSAPSCGEVVSKAFLEILGFIVLILPMAYIYVFTKQYEPYHRGFFCDDENLKHPYKEQTVPITICVAIWASVSVIFIVLVETIRNYAEVRCKTNPRRIKPIRDNNTPWIAVELYRHFGYFSLGALTTLLFTELAKYTVGRLRPHYLTLCDPELTEELCKDEWGYNKFVDPESVVCRDLSEERVKQLHEARLSFLSGHSSFSFYCGMFLIIYLQARLNNMPYIERTSVRICYRVLKVIRPFLQFAMIILSFWVSLTRISDYFHHPMDVVAGALVGVIFALITLTVIADLFNKRSAFWKSVRPCIDKTVSSRTNTSEVILTERTRPNLRSPEPEGWSPRS